MLGGGYSYPPPFAVGMVPLAALPFGVAVALFTALSVAVFATTIAWWLQRVVRGAGSTGRRRVLALGAGLYPPVAGSVFAGQANLLVVGLLGLGLAPFIPTLRAAGRLRSVGSGVLIGLAGIVKLAPLVLALPLALAAAGARDADGGARDADGRARGAGAALVGIVLGVVGSVGLAALVAPAANQGAGALSDLFAPDPFWTNQSINGAVSRLFLDGDRTRALFSGDPLPAIVALTAALAVATGVVLVRAFAGSRRADPGVLALALSLSIVAAAVGAPKNSFWNDAPVLLAVALALAAVRRPQGNFVRALGGTWLVATVVEVVSDPIHGPFDGAVAPLRTLASDAGVVGLLGLWLAIAVILLDGDPASIPPTAVRGRDAGA
ncbi:MAG TPA: glycosyltransferase family 87 protein [Candidatus Limnocylindrales bacterium]|nr:glycosyltransferase family 87 protein [Candidatus Limnocylindrales bacterium]